MEMKSYLLGGFPKESPENETASFSSFVKLGDDRVQAPCTHLHI